MADHAVTGAGEQRVVGKAQRRHRAAAEPLLRHEGQARVAPLRGIEVPDRAAAADRIVLGVADGDLAGERREQFLLAVAGDAGDADDLAGAHLQVDRVAAWCRTDRASPA